MKSCHFYRIAQCSSKNSMTLLSFSMTFQAWKMVFLNSMTFHDQGAPWHQRLRLTVCNFSSRVVWSPHRICLLFSHTVCSSHVEGAKAVEESVVDPLETRYFPTCYHTKLCHSRSDHLGVGTGSKKFRDAVAPPPYDGGRLIPQKHATAPGVIIPNFFALDQTIWA